MVVLIWIGIGLIAGLLASRINILRDPLKTVCLTITLCVVGAIAGAIAFTLLGFPQAIAFVLATAAPLDRTMTETLEASFAVVGSFGAAAGSSGTLLAYHIIFRRREF